MVNFNNSLRAKRLNEYPSKVRPQVRGIVLHDTAGAGTEADARYLANDPDGRHVSVDFVVLRDGTVYKLNPDLTRFSTNHAGRHTRFKGLLNAAVNAHTIGIEISHKADPRKDFPEWPDGQVKAVAELCAQLCGDFDLHPANEITRDSYITTHQAIITDGSRSDPRNFPWPLFWGYFGAAHEGTTPPITNPEGDAPMDYQVVDGDTLWSVANKFHTTVEHIKALNGMNTPSNVITVGQRLLVKE